MAIATVPGPYAACGVVYPADTHGILRHVVHTRIMPEELKKRKDLAAPEEARLCILNI